MNTARRREPDTSLQQIRNAVFINVISAVITSILIAAGALLWKDNQSNKERLGFLVAELQRKEREIANVEKRHQQKLDTLTRHVIELEEFIVNDGFRPNDDLCNGSLC